jgi:hypothetical protein
MTSVARDLAHFISGRGLGGGVAYLPGLCNGTPYGVSANLGGFFPTPLADNNGQNWDIYVVAHEIGHNFGAPHTHNYAPPLDGCGSSPQDCTAAGAGTIMSYCHICSGGVQNIQLRFHPGNIATIEQHLSSVGCQYTGPARPPTSGHLRPVQPHAHQVREPRPQQRQIRRRQCRRQNGGDVLPEVPDIAAPEISKGDPATVDETDKIPLLLLTLMFLMAPEVTAASMAAFKTVAKPSGVAAALAAEVTVTPLIVIDALSVAA